MKLHLAILLISLCLVQLLSSQDGDGVVALNLPLRNSFTFNRYLINPTFSFVREQTKFISITNKREWVQFNDAPQSYIANFGGRFQENIGAGVSLFQQNYGILTTFGGVLNFAYNVQLGRRSNLTFGLNLGAYQSGVNTAKAITNLEDPALQNVPQNFLLTVEPGINFGTEFFDFGLSYKNLALYNFEFSELVQDNPQQGIQAHVMYTGYLLSRGFLDNSKFTGLLRSEFYEEDTIISGLAMLTIPSGIWGQVGYNSVFGISGGIGLNITENISAEYNYETALGEIRNFGASHEITLAYRFTPDRRLNYSNDDEITGLISTDNRKRSYRKSTSSKTETKRIAEQKAKEQAEARAQAEALVLEQEKAKQEAQVEAQRLAEAKARQEAEAKAQAEAQQLAEEKARQEAEAKAQAEAQRLAEEKAKQEAEAKSQAEAQRLAEEKARQEAEAKAQAEARRLAEEKAKQEAEAKAQAEVQRLAEAKLIADSRNEKPSDSTSIEELIQNSTDVRTQALQSIASETQASSVEQDNLLKQLDSMVIVKDTDLKALKEENDLTEQGIAVQPRPFKSISAENNRLNKIKSDLDKLISSRDRQIDELEELYEETIIGDTITNDVVMLYYKKEIKRLRAEQVKAVATKARLDSQLETIRVATEFERRRRIKRAAFDNEDERYEQDRATLKRIRETTPVADTVLNTSDFDFGEDQGKNIKILKNINNTETGYYMILAVHSNVEQRDAFLRNVVASGNKTIDFFYDVNTSKYYIYSKKYNTINEATRALESKGSLPYNSKMSVVKIEN